MTLVTHHYFVPSVLLGAVLGALSASLLLLF